MVTTYFQGRRKEVKSADGDIFITLTIDLYIDNNNRYCNV